MLTNEQENYQVALVTGAARGIGREIALSLARKGISVGLCDILPDVKKTCNEILAMGVPCTAEIIDVTDEADVLKGFESITNKLGKVDVLVNNAGIGKLKSLVDVSTEEWDATFSVNIRGPFLFCKNVLPNMMEQRKGLIVNIASIWGLRGARGRSTYAASKHALVGLSRCLADEYRDYGIRVVAVCPGNVLTDLVTEDYAEKNKWMHPRDVAHVISFLCDPSSRGIVGTTLEIDGWGKPPEFK